ncbi:hypothetical protein TNCV_260101 [Trichonephila clavipes]|uniref:Transposase n=1 Tax=Trichonephila clavipes TaxID=2585209 RepID=A0A8X6V5E8_TRICX|nr:hypothetical protein TNCV_260101 [Trichonephila clavipes]
MANNQSVRRHLDAFTRGRITGKLEEGRSVTSVAEVRNCSQHRFTTLETISNYRNSYPGFSSGHPRGTTPVDDRYIVLQARRNRRQTAGEIATHDTGDWTTDIAFYRGQKTARWWSVCTTPCTVCTFNACPLEKAFSEVMRADSV